MPTFSYEAKDNTGRTVSGLIEAGEARGAAGALREQGLWPTRIDPLGATAKAAAPDTRVGAQSRIEIAPWFGSVPLTMLAMMYRQFATLMDSGVPIAQSMTTLAKQTTNGRLKQILGECSDAVNRGSGMSSVMERYPGTFNGIQLELIRAGETSGQMDLMATRIAEYLEKEIDIRRRLKQETLYPKIVLFVAWLVGGLLLYLRIGGKGSVGGMLTATAIAVGTLFAVWWGGRYLCQYPSFGARWDYVKLLVPGTGGVTRRYATARFTRALASMYSSGILLPRAVESAARACGNRAIGQQIVSHAGALNMGEGISTMLERAGLLSPMAVQMARTGEQTGGLDIMMNKVADYLEGEADSKAHQLAVFAGVAALLFASLIVGYIVISAYGGMASSAVNGGGAE